MKTIYRKRFKPNASTVSGTVFTITWDRFKSQIEKRNNGRLGTIVSVRADDEGIHIFTEDGDMSAWYPEF
jgi:hypothetical protein